MTLTAYDESHYEKSAISDIKQIKTAQDRGFNIWLSVQGLGDIEVISSVGKEFGIDPMALEDIINTDQRTKMEEWGNQLFLVFHHFFFDVSSAKLDSVQVSIIVGSGYVLSFIEGDSDPFGDVRGRIQSAKGRIRRMGPGYLCHALMDSVVDGYFHVLEDIAGVIEDVEIEVIRGPQESTLHRLYGLKRELVMFRKGVWPLRDVAYKLERGDIGVISEDMGVFFRDIRDHTIHVTDTIGAFGEIVSGMLETYMSIISNRMNDVMKVLTMFASIFIPLTFVAGVYGMNFEYMPELSWRWGYYGVLSLMALMSASMAFYFRIKRWI